MATIDAVLDLTRALIAAPSVTPNDAGCLDVIGARLAAIGFHNTRLDLEGVSNLWAVRGHGTPQLLFAGHTDVVPPGPEVDWHSPPFVPAERDGYLFGRGAADMKSSLAAMVVACERIFSAHPDRDHPCIAFLLTSDEEGVATHGTRHVVEWLREQNIAPRYCIVGEPSSSAALGDVARNGRRGSLSATLHVKGIQGHVAYPELARNPIHDAAPALAELAAHRWDEGNAYYPPSSLQISNVHAGTGANNVIPGTLTAEFNIRFSTEQTDTGLRTAIEAVLDRHKLEYTIQWHLSGQPFLTPRGILTKTVAEAIHAHTGETVQYSTSGGTSDGRFIATLGTEVVELGPVNATIHKTNECVRIADLEPLARIYAHVAAELLGLPRDDEPL